MSKYHTVYKGFPPKSLYLNKGIGEGMVWVSLSAYKTSYLPKAVTRWKHNMRKQLDNKEYFNVMSRTTLFSGDLEKTVYWINTITKIPTDNIEVLQGGLL
jgi:hypothetical protein